MKKMITARFHDGRPNKAVEFTPGSHLRQGDTFLEMVSEIPSDAVPHELKGGVIAEGEVTGHAHRLTPATSYEVMYTKGDGQIYIKVLEGKDCEYIHEDHGHIILPGGTNYAIGAVKSKAEVPGKVVVQREWTPQGAQNVRD